MYDQRFIIDDLFAQRMIVGEDKKLIDSCDPKDLPVTIIMCSFPEIFFEERIHSWKKEYGTPVFGRRLGVTVILTSYQTDVFLFDFVFRHENFRGTKSYYFRNLI